MRQFLKRALLILSAIVFVLGLTMSSAIAVFAASSSAMTRQGDTVWLGYYPQMIASEAELQKMSATPDENQGFSFCSRESP